MKISHALNINAKPEKVFSWISSPDKAKLWMTSVGETEIIQQTPEMIGTTFREVVEKDGRGTELRGVITAYEENETIAFHLSGKFNTVDVTYHLEELEDHTRLTLNADVRLKSLMKLLNVFVGTTLKKNILGQSQKEFAKLKELCETDT